MFTQEKLFRILYLVGGFIFILISTTSALEAKYSENIMVFETEVIDKDIAMAARSIRVEGTIDGDLIAVARSISIDGSVNQDMIAGAERIDISGELKDDLRAAAVYLTIDGKVGSDLTTFCENLVIGKDAQIGAELLVACNKAEIHGSVGNKIQIWAEEIVVSGNISGDVDLAAGKIILLPSTVIEGNLNYKSENQIEIQEGAKILGLVNWKRVEPARQKPKGISPISIFFKIIFLLAAIIVGMTIIALSRKHARLVSDIMISSFWMSLGIGFVFLVCLPVAAIIVGITLIGIPISIFSIFVYIMALYFSSIFTGLTVGRGILGLFKKDKEVSLFFSLIIGMIILTLLVNIPYIGWLIRLVSILLGMGALLISRVKFFTELKQKEVI